MGKKVLGRALSGRTSMKAKRIAAASRVRKLNKVLKVAKGKAEPLRQAMERAQARLKAAEKTCKDLRAQGEEVPADGEKDFSAPGCWKPPGVRAANERKEARAALAKAEVAWKKADGVLTAKMERTNALREKILGPKEKETSTEERASSRKKIRP